MVEPPNLAASGRTESWSTIDLDSLIGSSSKLPDEMDSAPLTLPGSSSTAEAWSNTAAHWAPHSLRSSDQWSDVAQLSTQGSSSETAVTQGTHAFLAAPGRASLTRPFAQMVDGAMQLADGARHLGALVGHDAVRLLKPLAKNVPVVAAHALQQAVTCGVPTFARELVAIGVTSGLANHPYAAAGLHVGLTMAVFGLQRLRYSQMAREPDVAARGFHGMTLTDWEQLQPEAQEQMRSEQQYHARLVTYMQTGAIAANTAILTLGLATDQPELVSSTVGFALRDILYATSREPLQASFSLTATVMPPGRATGGVDPAGMATSAAMYGAATGISSYLQEVLLPFVLPEGVSMSRSYARDETNALLTGTGMMAVAARVAGVRASTNTLVEIVDAYQSAHHAAAAGGGRQIVNPQRTGVDYARLFDHSPLRIAWNSIGGLPGSLAQFMAPSEGRSFIGNVGGAAAFALSYMSVNQNYQAAAAVRRQVREAEAQGQPMSQPTSERPQTA